MSWYGPFIIVCTTQKVWTINNRMYDAKLRTLSQRLMILIGFSLVETNKNFGYVKPYEIISLVHKVKANLFKL